VRILREAEACESGTIGAFLRSEGIYSSQLYAWRRERERGDLDSGALRKRAVALEAKRVDAQRIVELETATPLQVAEVSSCRSLRWPKRPLPEAG